MEQVEQNLDLLQRALVEVLFLFFLFFFENYLLEFKKIKNSTKLERILEFILHLGSSFFLSFLFVTFFFVFFPPFKLFVQEITSIQELIRENVTDFKFLFFADSPFSEGFFFFSFLFPFSPFEFFVQ